MREVSAFFENEPELGSLEGDRFEMLLTLVEAYESKHFPIELPDPVEAIKFRMEQCSNYKTELAIKYQKRFEKNARKLFTFLDYDNVPWNNNNAEHAIKPLALLRHVFRGVSSPKGISDYLVLLSVEETCKYRGISFLDFLRSGELDIDKFSAGGRLRLKV